MFEEIKEWQKQRLGKITASEAYKLMSSGRGKDEYFGKTAISYINEKISELVTGEPCKSLSGLNSIEWGNAHEVEAIIELERSIWVEVTAYGGQNNKFFPLNAFSGGSPDALTDLLLCEIKCPYNSSVHISNLLAALSGQGNKWMKDNRPEYYVQMQMNMLCTGREGGIFVSYDPRTIDESHRLSILKIDKDDSMQKEIIERINKAAEIISESLDILFANKVLLAERDQELNATIIEQVFDPSLLKKIN